ncbi:MAG: type II toxin-antitoxin system RelE/ParE family toxin [Hyphomicrobiales bacterium]
MIEVLKTDIFLDWLRSLRDLTGRAAIEKRIDRLELGNAGDVAPIGSGVSEMRIHVGSGYRVYFVQRGKTVVVLLCGGDKGSQFRDIVRARELAAEVKDELGW